VVGAGRSGATNQVNVYAPNGSQRAGWPRLRAGDAGYAGSFIDHYLLPVIYPAGLTPQLQVVLGVAVIAINMVVYWRLWRRRRAI